MFAIVWTIVASVLTILGTALLARSGILGKQLAPDSADNIRHLVETLEPLIRSQRDLFQVISNELDHSTELAAKLPMTIVDANRVAAERADKAYGVIHKALNTAKAAETAGKVRLNVVAGSSALALAVVISTVLAVVAYMNQNKSGAESIKSAVVQIEGAR
jgi:hypothetical protein